MLHIHVHSGQGIRGPEARRSCEIWQLCHQKPGKAVAFKKEEQLH